ncbi:MCE family protein [Mycolicibacterium aichiense]|uniref:Mammalian cell entry protein n=1 Tax=Mycolicibacterium aichiense TaxID=1799 RepID=A0AAD1MC04_9MYCO|nr:MCE family protein [Mycolicibacterium aichiense]MCV7019826.1 MCE family protein [Mycolicibacterium aichiense]BBX06799.1 mammalian cell entry protein [Mycolicibacterium aichiense]STZ80614.1 virulence factor Mce family protein [Mycolicibacterium aichiense]
MLKYRQSRLVRTGFIGAVLIILVITVGLQPERLTAWATSLRFQAVFAEAGGLTTGNDVRLAGMKVGQVDDVSLDDEGKALITFSVDSAITLGNDTSAHIRTGTLLGQRILTLESAGNGLLRRGAVIPLSRTSSPYSLTEAVTDLTTNTAGTDTHNINASLDALSDTIEQITPQLGPTFEGLTKVSRSLNARNDSLRELLKSAASVTGTLSERSQQLNTLILDANDLVAVLNERREAIVSLLASTSALARELSGLVADNEKELAPTLQKLNSVTAMLEKNRDNIAKALPGLAKYEMTQGEAVASGYFYQSYVPNLIPAQVIQPFLDYALGFRRGVNNGQPPDNAGPRAELPLPYNGIPGGSR